MNCVPVMFIRYGVSLVAIMVFRGGINERRVTKLSCGL
jgi:hypothetical protein